MSSLTKILKKYLDLTLKDEQLKEKLMEFTDCENPPITISSTYDMLLIKVEKYHHFKGGKNERLKLVSFLNNEGFVFVKREKLYCRVIDKIREDLVKLRWSKLQNRE